MSESTEVAIVTSKPMSIANQGSTGLQVRTYEDVGRLANMVCASGLVKGANENEIKAQIMTRVLFGAEIGVSPMAAIQGIYVQNGNPNCKAELIASLIMKSGIYKFKTLEATDQKASLKFFEKENGEWKEAGIISLTWEEAKAKKLTEGPNSHTWAKFPRNMLFKQCLQDGRRFFCPGLLNGVALYTEEEAAEIDLDEKIKESPFAAQKEVAQKIAEQKAAELAEAHDVEVVEEQKPAPVEPTHGEKMEAAAVVAEAKGAPAEVVQSLKEGAKGLSSPQTVKLMSAGKLNGWSIKDVLKVITAPPYNLDTDNWKREMTERQYDELLKRLETTKPEA